MFEAFFWNFFIKTLKPLKFKILMRFLENYTLEFKIFKNFYNFNFIKFGIS